MAERPTQSTSYTFYTVLESTSNAPDIQINPSLQAGDVQISRNGSGFVNITTLPVVTPVSGSAIKVDLSSSEMSADNVLIQFIDATGAEWNDRVILLQPQEALITLTDIASSGDLQAVRDSLTTVSGNVDTVTTNLATTDGKVDLVTSNLGVVSGNLDTVDSNVDSLVADLVNISGNVDTAISNLTDISGNVDTISTNLLDVSGNLTGVKGKTDQMVFTKANELDINLQSINDVTITGDGSPSKFGV